MAQTRCLEKAIAGVTLDGFTKLTNSGSKHNGKRMSQRDYYEVLGIERDATDKVLKRAYHKLAMEYHPDRNTQEGAEAKFKEASEAYSVLSDPQKRQLYDTHGFAGLRSSGFSGFQGVGVDEIFSNFGDIFGDLFGFGGGRSRRGGGASRGRDLRLEFTVDFEDAVFGCTKDVTVDQQVACARCDGAGAEPGSRPTTCATCQGRGQVVHGQGMFLVSTTCPECRGAGKKITNPCRDCKGEGRELKERELNIKVPAGFSDGMSLRYTGEGEPSAPGGAAGDLYIRVHVRPHDKLQREGDDLLLEHPIDMALAALGGEIEVAGVDGQESITVPKGTQPNDVITLKRKGVPRLRGGGRGDFHIVCRVQIPRSLSSAQKTLLEEFQALGGKKKRSFFS
jgi:molecular chaperone DnaJ